MRGVTRSLALSLTPPAVVEAARFVKRKLRPTRPAWEVVPGGWAAVRGDGAVRGWNIASAVEASVARAREFVTANLNDRLPFGCTALTVNAPAPSIEFHNTAESFVHAFLSSTRLLRQASVLDWGGGVGQYWEICRAVAPDLVLDYHCSELPEFARRGRQLYPAVTFHEGETWAGRTYDFVFASSSLHYSEDWRETLRRLASAAPRGRLFITRIPVTFESPSYVFVQRPYAWGFGTEYAAWCFNRREFLAAAESLGLVRVWEFITGERAEITGASEVAEFRGFLFDVPTTLR
jgi:putative methyltransferase (TIGR04325 family)